MISPRPDYTLLSALHELLLDSREPDRNEACTYLPRPAGAGRWPQWGMRTRSRRQGSAPAVGSVKGRSPGPTARDETRRKPTIPSRGLRPSQRTLGYTKRVLGEGPMRGLEFTYYKVAS